MTFIWQLGRDFLIINFIAFIIMLFFIIRLVRINTKLKKTEKALKKERDNSEKLIFYDSLTSLPNMNYFRQQVGKELAKEGDKLLAIIMLDLDRFRLINDIYGRSFGDKIIKKISNRLSTFFKDKGLVSRISSDDFAILVTKRKQVEEIDKLADNLAKVISVPIHIDQEEFYIQASMGIAIYPGDGANLDLLLKAADSALHKTKEIIDSNYQLYNKDMHLQNTRRMFIEKNLGKAIERKEIKVYYQPLIDLASGEIIGAEALARWKHPEKGLLLPGEFIPIAEETGDIIPLGDFILEEASSQFQSWSKDGHQTGYLSINLSPRQFVQEDLISRINIILRKNAFPKNKLIFEITETAAILNPGNTAYTIKKLKSMGIKLVLDDFGTGYSSLNYLSRFPVNGLKIDRSFIKLLDDGEENELLVAAIIAMADQLGIDVVAEGVETRQQLEFLKEHQCKYSQGFYYHPPVPAEDYLKIISKFKANVEG